MNRFLRLKTEFLRFALVGGMPFAFTLDYRAGWLSNSVTHDVVFRLVNRKLIAFLVATAVSSCTNFIGQKLIVFQSKGAIVQ